MTLYEKHGLRIPAEDYLEALSGVKQRSTAFRADRTFMRIVDERGCLALVYYLQDDLNAAKSQAKTLLSEAENYFFGAWRAEMDPSTFSYNRSDWRERLFWMDQYIVGSSWAAVLGEQQMLRKLSSYPSENLWIDPDGNEQMKSVYVQVAHSIRNGKVELADSFRAQVDAGDSVYAKHLVAILAQMEARSAELLTETFNRCLLYYKKSVFNKKSMRTLVSYEVSLLLAVSKTMLGIECKVDDSLMDYVIR